MLDFSTRSNKKELLDGDNIPFEDLAQNLKELNFINSKLGGHAITLKGLRKLTQGKNKKLSVLEIGCGGGDNLFYLKRKSRSQNFDFKGLDLKAECIEFAKQRYDEIEFTTSDYRAEDKEYDIIFSSLFCHHFTDDELIEQFKWIHAHARMGFFINDLERNPVAYNLIKILTKLFSKSYLVKHDAPLSVARAFKRKELASLLKRAGLEQFEISWQWAFRYLVVCKKTAI